MAVLVAAPLVLAGLGRAPFDDPGEGMHAEIARELVLSGDPFALTLGGVRYVDKPPLLYALVAVSFVVSGPGEAAARAVPAAAGLAAVAATAWLGARLLGTSGGVLAGLALTSSFGFFAYSRYVRPETLLLAALGSGFALTLIGLRDRRRGLVGAGLVAFALGGLAKDPLAVVGPLAAVGGALVLGGQGQLILRRASLLGLAACLTLALGWWVLAELRTPGFTWYTVVDNHVRNIFRIRLFPDEDVPLSAAEFLAVAVLGAAPWGLAAVVALVELVRRRAWRERGEVPWIALGLWVLAVLGLTVASPFRLPHYGLPAYPALAVLAARGWVVHGSRRLVAVHAGLLGAMALACGVFWWGDGLAFVDHVVQATDVASRKRALAGQALPVPPWEDFRPLLAGAAVVFGAGALATAAVALAARGDQVARRWGSVAVLVAMLAALPLVSAALELVSSHRAVQRLALEIARGAARDDVVAHEGPVENSGALEWYSGRRPVIVDGRRSVLGFGATLPDAQGRFWDENRLRAAWASERRVWLLTIRPPGRSVVAGLPGARLVAQDGSRWLYVSR